MMENRRRNVIVILVGVIVLATIIWFVSQTDEHYNWTETYADRGAQPYDVGLFRKVLESSYGEDFITLEGLFGDTSYLESSASLMVVVDGYALFDSLRAEKLREFVERGNTLFISSNTAGPIISRLRLCDEDSLVDSRLSQKVVLSSRDQKVELSFDRYNEPIDFSWFYFQKPGCGSSKGTIELAEEQLSNFLRIDQGNGAVYIHTTPLVFTNYHFRRKEVFDYVDQVLPTSEGKVYYLEPGPMPDLLSKPAISESPLRFILAHPPLKWAWYLILLATLLYVLNAMRRKQRSIPVQTLPKNQTMAFVDMTYRLFSKEGRHSDIVNSQYRLLLLFLRNKYGIAVRDIESPNLSDVSEKLKMKPEYLKNFFKKLERSRYNSTLSDQELLEIDRKITEFYLKCP